MTEQKLNIGCGNDYKRGWINLDLRKNVKTDIIWNLNKFPYPFKDNEFDEILMQKILEHLDNPIKVLKEVIRIIKNKGKIIILVPHAWSYSNITDIQHKTNFSENSFDENFLKKYELYLILKLKKKEFIFINKWKKYIFFKKYLKVFFNGIYDDIKFEFEVNKIK